MSSPNCGFSTKANSEHKKQQETKTNQCPRRKAQPKPEKNHSKSERGKIWKDNKVELCEALEPLLHFATVLTSEVFLLQMFRWR